MNPEIKTINQNKINHKVEILAPAGNFEVLKSAIATGCDAVYLAGKAYGARAYANNFTDEELIEAIDYAHLYNVKVFVTVNTVIFEDEMIDVIKYIDRLYLNQVDGVIVQDLGLASIIKRRYPDLRLHASTQINAQTINDVKTLKEIGFDRVILGREVSLDTIKEIRKNVSIEIEVFVHGALCMSYSGACYFSSLEGDRSGNRGRCAQPCRLKYHICEDNINNIDNLNNDLKGREETEKYYLSPKDLCTLDNITEIIKYVDSIKIEGRMKSKEYVSSVIESYKKVIEGYLNKEYYNLNELKYNMQIAFNRGYTKGFINNCNNDDFTNIETSNHQGVYVGKVESYLNGRVSIKLTKELYDKDSIRIVSKDYQDAITINGMQTKIGVVKKAFINEVITVRSHKPLYKGDEVFLTKREVNDVIEPKVLITGTMYTKDKRFYLEISDGTNKVVDSVSYQRAEKDLFERIKKQIKKTGDTIYQFTDIINNCDELVYVEIKEINEMRRNLLFDLDNARLTRYKNREINRKAVRLEIPTIPSYAGYSVAVSNKSQLDVVRRYQDDNNFKSNIYSRIEEKEDMWYYLPRVKNETKNSPSILAVSSNLGNRTLISSVYMNVTNSYTVRVLESLGYQKIGLSIELSKEKMKLLVDNYYKHFNRYPNLEVMIYGHYQMMYMKHCFLNKAKGYSKLHCGECKKDILINGKYAVFGDSECHLALLSADPVCLFSKIKELSNIGINNFLIDFTKENEEQIIECFKNLSERKNVGYFGHYLKEVL